MWLLTWRYPSQGEFECVGFDSEREALLQAASEVLNQIKSEWDMTQLDQAVEASLINDEFIDGDFRQAINYFNMSNTNATLQTMFWDVVEIVPAQQAWLVASPLTHDYLTGVKNNPDDEEDTPSTKKSSLAITPGATCRGPRCGTYSSYAFADQSDGTYLCHQCKMLSSVFGGIKS